MKRHSRHICFLIFLLPALMGARQAAYGQSAAAPAPRPLSVLSVRASVDQQRILLGQPLHLLLEALVPGNAPLAWPPLDSLPHFTFLEKGKIDSALRPGERYYRWALTITSFDSGAWVIPRLPFAVGNKRALTDSVRVAVDFSKFDPSKDYHDIRDIIDLPNPFTKWIGWFVAAVSALSLAIVVWMVGRKRTIVLSAPPPEAAAPRLPPYEEALARLEELARQRSWENGPVKAYYTRLNDILRVFVLRRLGIASLAETNEELIGQLRGSLDPDTFSQLAETLRMSDFVKFAKYQPAITDNEYHFQVIRSSVDGLNRIALEHEAEQARNRTNLAIGPGDDIPGDEIDKENNTFKNITQ